MQPIDFLSELRASLERAVARAERSGDEAAARRPKTSRRRKHFMWALAGVVVLGSLATWAALTLSSANEPLRFTAMTVPAVDPLAYMRRSTGMAPPPDRSYGDSLVSLAVRTAGDVWAVGSRTSRVSHAETSQETTQTALV